MTPMLTKCSPPHDFEIKHILHQPKLYQELPPSSPFGSFVSRLLITKFKTHRYTHYFCSNIS